MKLYMQLIIRTIRPLFYDLMNVIRLNNSKNAKVNCPETILLKK